MIQLSFHKEKEFIRKEFEDTINDLNNKIRELNKHMEDLIYDHKKALENNNNNASTVSNLNYHIKTYNKEHSKNNK